MSDVAERPKDPLTLPGPWNAVAKGYDEEFFGRVPALTERAMVILAAGPRATVLDVATGPGTLAVELSPTVERVIAVNFAESMIERLKAHLAAGSVTNVEARVMDGQALDLPDASVDAGASMFGIFLFDDRPRALSELFRVIRPGGTALVTSWLPPDRNTMIGAGMQALRDAIPELPKPSGPLPTQTEEVCAAELGAAGFSSVRTELVDIGVTYPSSDEYFLSFERGGAPMALLRKKLGEVGFEAAKGRALASLRTRFGAGALELRCAAIFTSGVR